MPQQKAAIQGGRKRGPVCVALSIIICLCIVNRIVGNVGTSRRRLFGWLVCLSKFAIM